MIIQALLTLSLCLCIVYAFIQRRKSRFISYGISVVSLFGIYFVIFPEQSNRIAAFVGVGRGADLIMYCWVVISLIVSLNLQLKLLSLQQVITTLIREHALFTAEKPVNIAEK